MFRYLHAIPLVTASVLLTAVPNQLSAQLSGTTCRGGSGGGFSAGPLEVIHSLTHDRDGMHLDAVVLVRASAEWRQLSPTAVRPAALRPDGAPRLLSGGTVGPLWVQYERRAGTLWLDADSVLLGASNVALVEVDSMGHPHVVGTARVEPRQPPAGANCRPPATRDESLAFQETIMAAIRRDSVVRAFIDR